MATEWMRIAKRIAVVVAIIVLAWWAFLSLVEANEAKYEAEPVLIMIWVSALVLLLAMQPQLLSAIKGFKFGELVEVELRESLAESTLDSYVALADLTGGPDDQILAEKDSHNSFAGLLNQVRENPKKPVLLTADLRGDHYISKPMLFIYVYFLFQMSPSVTVLFLAGPAASLDEKKRADRIVGAVSAQTFLRVFQRQCPWFSRVSHFDTPAAPPDPQRSMFDRLLEAGVVPGSDFFNGRLNSIRYFGSVPQTYREVFTKNEVREWFGSSLSKRTVNADLEDASLRSIRRALRAGTSM